MVHIVTLLLALGQTFGTPDGNFLQHGAMLPPLGLPEPIPSWDVHSGGLKMTERTPRNLTSPSGPNWLGTGSTVWRYVHFTLALVLYYNDQASTCPFQLCWSSFRCLEHIRALGQEPRGPTIDQVQGHHPPAP